MKYFLSILFISGLIACSDSDDQETNGPFLKFFTDQNVRIDTVDTPGQSWQYGFKFRSLKNQTITKLGIKVPATGNYRCLLYDLDLKETLIDTVVKSTVKHAESYITIPSTEIEENGNFGVAIVSDVFFKATMVDGKPFEFPLNLSGIEITSFHEGQCPNGNCNQFPNAINNLIIAPCVNIVIKE